MVPNSVSWSVRVSEVGSIILPIDNVNLSVARNLLFRTLFLVKRVLSASALLAAGEAFPAKMKMRKGPRSSRTSLTVGGCSLQGIVRTVRQRARVSGARSAQDPNLEGRSEEHTSELQPP